MANRPLALLLALATIFGSTVPSAATDLIWTDAGSYQVLRGAADGNRQLYGIDDYPGPPDDHQPLGVTFARKSVFWLDAFGEQILTEPADGSGPANVVYDLSGRRGFHDLTIAGE